MAKSSKKKTNKSQSNSSKQVEAEQVPMTLEDSTAEDIVFEDATEDDEGMQESVDSEGSDDQTDSAQDIPEMEESADPGIEDVSEDKDAVGEIENSSDNRFEEQPAPAQPEAAKQSGFLPLVLGGVAAAAIGYGFATFGPRDAEIDYTGQLSAQAERIEALEASLAQAPEAPDLSVIEAQISEASAQLAAQATAISDLGEDLITIDERVLEVEKRPGADGTLSDTALAAYQRELEELRADLDAQKEDVLSAAAQAEADLAAARAEAAELEQAALEQAEAAAARAALNNVETAIGTGAPFEGALASLPGDVPTVLADAAVEGVATTAELIEDFPAMARAALATARAEGLTDDAGGFGGFLRTQLDVRSTTPQEGTGADAVLSRAEAAVEEGRVADALAEIEALPEVARAEMTDWTARAQQRADVLDALASLSETLN